MHTTAQDATRKAEAEVALVRQRLVQAEGGLRSKERELEKLAKQLEAQR